MARIRPYPDVFIGLKEATYKAEKFTMDEKRHYIPKMVKEYTGRNGDSGKGRNLYDRPSDVPKGIPWLDPNNKDSSNKKPTQKTIDPMFDFLLKWYIENLLRQESVTESRNVQPAVDLSIAPSGESSDNQSNVYSRLREYISASQSINNTSAMLPQNFYSHDHETENCDRVCKSLRKVTSALEDQGEDTQHVESIIKSLETYKIRKKENKRMWDCLRKIRDLTEKFEAYGINRGFEQELRTLYENCFIQQETTRNIENTGEDQPSNVNASESTVFEDAGLFGIEQRDEDLPDEQQLVSDKDPMLSSCLPELDSSFLLEHDLFSELKVIPTDSVVDLFKDDGKNASSEIGVAPTNDQASSQLIINYITVTTRQVCAEPGPSTSGPMLKRECGNEYSIPSKLQKLDESCSNTGVSHEIMSIEPQQQGGGKAALEDLMGKDNPPFRGVESGIDTSNDLESDDDRETVIPPMQNQHYSEATTSNQNITPLRSETSTTASVPQARRKIAPKRIIPQVQSNEELTRDVLLLQKEVYTLKKQKLELQLEELRHNKRMRDTRPTGNLPPTPIMTAQVTELPAAVAELVPGVYEAYDLSFQDTSYRL